MRATLMYGPGDVRVEEVADPRLREATDVVVRITRSCVCGSDLWPYQKIPVQERGVRMGHEFIGVVEEVGGEVATLRRGDLVVAPFVWSDNTCDYCKAGLQTSCRNGGGWGPGDVDGGQGEAVRVPQADGTLVKLPVGEDDALMPSLLTLSDVFSTGHHAAVCAGVRKGSSVAVIGDGAVGLCAVLAARRLGAEQILLLGRHTSRTDLGREFGATEVVAARGEQAVAAVRDLTGGDGVTCVLECVGTKAAFDTALDVVKPGGSVSRVGVPQYSEANVGPSVFRRNLRIVGGIAPARQYIPELLPDVLSGAVEPGRVFDRTVGLDEVPDAYRAMNDRQALKVLIRP
ncbi:alcohol dehydrogenase catalytic domain-containing protein [Kutzneria viridogrisea]|uniref:Enoyl reductase (ER) domain-containing protein n=2 Tax=Kutzneria TaxID=43356 RepID=W5WD10_9PSEU|nr:alcohol dehydrogenase catalytic domain-containing protein [Kutzneria albida]AHH98461.1 hypothetical protein KALB_5099 [Kutzneria albida DSM 43870]MBA8923954.1 hypothetical protein [Kutzneria viridogrisea]